MVLDMIMIISSIYKMKNKIIGGEELKGGTNSVWDLLFILILKLLVLI